MRVWQRKSDDVLLTDAASGEVVTAAEVSDLANRFAESADGVALLFADLSLLSLTRFLALVEARIPVVLLDASMTFDASARLLSIYSPELVLTPDAESPALHKLRGGEIRAAGEWVSRRKARTMPNPELAVLLTTSGSTGSPKLVRLSRDNILSNARAISDSLSLRPSDRVVTSLPIFYSFGMSLVTSHVVAGSSVVVTSRSVLEREFWSQMAENGITHFAGVPPTYAMLKRLRFRDRELPHLRALLQAGGRLAPELIAHFAEDSERKGRQFFVMYGQTEASPRMACLPPERLPQKLGSVGLALKGGTFRIVGEDGRELPTGQAGEIIYEGPNVMMGYAQSREDLARGDEQAGILRTGDLGYLDEDDFLYVTGRTKRIAKVSGVRVSLDDVEAMLASIAPVAVVEAPDDGIVVYTTHCDQVVVDDARRQLARDLAAALPLIKVNRVTDLPLLPSGKTDYGRLKERARGGE